MKKKSVWQRIQALICFLLLLCVFVPFGAAAISPKVVGDLILLVDGQQVTGLTAALAGTVPSMRVVYGVAAVIGLLCSLRLLTLVFARGGRDRSGVSLQNATDGPIHISVPAVETLVSQGIRDVPGLSDVRMKVHDYGDSVTIDIAMSARSDINIPETMMRLQSRIKAYVQESAGIEVREVRLNVEKVLLADGIQALPAGRGMKRVSAPAQDANTPKLAIKPDTEAPDEPRTAPQPATAASTVEDDDDTDTDWNRKGWFGRFGHKKREPDAAVDESAVARAAQGDDAASVPSQLPQDDENNSIKAHIAEYMTGESQQAPGGQSDGAASSAAQVADSAPACHVEAVADAAVDAPEAGTDVAATADVELPAAPEQAVERDVAGEVEPALNEASGDENGVSAVLAADAAAEADAPVQPEGVQPGIAMEAEPADGAETVEAHDYDAVIAEPVTAEPTDAEPRTIVVGDTSEVMVYRDEADETKSEGNGAGGQAIPL